MRLSRNALLAGFVIPVLLAGCGEAGPDMFEMPPPEVGYLEVVASDVVLETELPGRTNAYQIAEVRPQVTGVVLERLFEEGALVKQGQPLYRIDDRLYQAALDNARAALAQAQAAAETASLRARRMEALLDKQSVSRQEYDEAQAARKEADARVEAARAALKTAQVNLDYASIKAPIDGRTGRSTVTSGALVTANQPQALTTIRQLDPIYVDMSRSSGEMSRLRNALASGELINQDGSAEVVLILENGTEYAHKGALQFSEYAVDEATGTITLRALFPNPDQSLLPGQFLRARLPEGTRESAILIPQKAVQRDPRGNASVYLVDENQQAQLQPIQTVRSIGNEWLVSSGLATGDKVIVEGLQNVRPGAQVIPVAVTADSQPSASAQGE